MAFSLAWKTWGASRNLASSNEMAGHPYNRAACDLWTAKWNGSQIVADSIDSA